MDKSTIWNKATELREWAERLEEHICDTDEDNLDSADIELHLGEIDSLSSDISGMIEVQEDEE